MILVCISQNLGRKEEKVLCRSSSRVEMYCRAEVGNGSAATCSLMCSIASKQPDTDVSMASMDSSWLSNFEETRMTEQCESAMDPGREILHIWLLGEESCHYLGGDSGNNRLELVLFPEDFGIGARVDIFTMESC